MKTIHFHILSTIQKCYLKCRSASCCQEISIFLFFGVKTIYFHILSAIQIVVFHSSADTCLNRNPLRKGDFDSASKFLANLGHLMVEDLSHMVNFETFFLVFSRTYSISPQNLLSPAFYSPKSSFSCISWIKMLCVRVKNKKCFKIDYVAALICLFGPFKVSDHKKTRIFNDK